MSAVGRFLLATLCGLVLAAVVHIVVVLAIPALAEQDAFHRLRAAASLEGAPAEGAQLITLPNANTWLPQADPATAVSACAFDLNDGPVRVSLKVGSLFQSLSVHARGEGIFFAVTDRAAVRGALDLVIMTRRQLDEVLANEDDDEPSRDVRIVAPKPEGFVIVRVLAPFPSLRPQAEETARSVSCTAEPV
jgi:uncharacterized membrane protein